MKRIIKLPGAAPVLFPAQDLSKFLQYVRDVWDELKLEAPAWWNMRKETDLVAGFFEALDNDERRMKAGVGFGHLFLEAVSIVLDANGLPKQSGRTDIRFAYSGPSFAPVLVLEFKRLDNKGRLRTHYVTNGVIRFITGQYAPTEDFGVMVGLVSGSVTIEKVALLKYLRRNDVRISTSSTGDLEPSHMVALDFDTGHSRSATTCEATEFSLGHLLLER
ncbi:hypothetical protein [Rhizobium sp. BR 249]|uniref:hypothetical protein n=1 Tax=Rhizobium sp. BR 249 TaxID=3040011 RepID=UPI0039BF6674